MFGSHELIRVATSRLRPIALKLYSFSVPRLASSIRQGGGDALTADRPYRAAMPVSKALAIMTEMEGTAVDPDCLKALRRALRRVDRSLIAPPA